MVKGSIKIVRNAHYEAQQRTVDVSVKPALGKNLFSDALIAAASGSFQGHFETERFVHNQIREFTLRAAAHCSDVRAVLPDRKASALRSDSVVHVPEHIKDVPESFKYRAAAETIDNSIGSIAVPEVPKELRVYVVAKMLHDLDLPLNQVEVNSPAQAKINEDRSNLMMRIALKRIVNAINHQDLKPASVFINSDGSVKVADFGISIVRSQMSLIDSSARSDDKGIWAQTRSAIVFLALLSLLSKTRGSSSDSLNCPEAKTCHHKYAERDSSVSKGTAQLHNFHTRKEEGFGTAPIWYQQSMANGPPEPRLAGNNALLAQG